MSDHVTFGQDSLRCLRCGAEYKIPMPSPIWAFTALGRGFGEEHADCEEGDGGQARFSYADAEEWLNSWDTGISSLTIFQVMTGRQVLVGRLRHPDTPKDPADFGRCHRLLKVVPEWRERLGEVAEQHPEWAPLVERWSELEALYVEELPSGEAPKLYALMRELLGGGR